MPKPFREFATERNGRWPWPENITMAEFPLLIAETTADYMDALAAESAEKDAKG